MLTHQDRETCSSTPVSALPGFSTPTTNNHREPPRGRVSNLQPTAVLRREGMSSSSLTSCHPVLYMGVPVVLGRQNPQLNISNIHVSREHCEVTAQDGFFLVHVCSSTNPVKLHLPSLLQPGLQKRSYELVHNQRMKVPAGTTITLDQEGEVRFHIEMETTAMEPSDPAAMPHESPPRGVLKRPIEPRELKRAYDDDEALLTAQPTKRVRRTCLDTKEDVLHFVSQACGLDMEEKNALEACIANHKIDGLVFDCMTMEDMASVLEIRAFGHQLRLQEALRARHNAQLKLHTQTPPVSAVAKRRVTFHAEQPAAKKAKLPESGLAEGRDGNSAALPAEKGSEVPEAQDCLVKEQLKRQEQPEQLEKQRKVKQVEAVRAVLRGANVDSDNVGSHVGSATASSLVRTNAMDAATAAKILEVATKWSQEIAASGTIKTAVGQANLNYSLRRQHAGLAVTCTLRAVNFCMNFSRLCSAVLKAQCLFRGHMARKCASQRRQAVLKVQSLGRAFLVRRMLRKKQVATLQLQCQVRGFLARRSILQKLAAAVKVQSIGRGFLARCAVKKTLAAVKIQAQFRGFSIRQRAARQHLAALKLQQVVRMFLAAKRAAANLRETQAAVRIQQFYRRYRARQSASARRSAAHILQAGARSFLARCLVRKKRAEQQQQESCEEEDVLCKQQQSCEEEDVLCTQELEDTPQLDCSPPDVEADGGLSDDEDGEMMQATQIYKPAGGDCDVEALQVDQSDEDDEMLQATQVYKPEADDDEMMQATQAYMPAGDDECRGTEDDEMMQATQVYKSLGGDECLGTEDDEMLQATQAYRPNSADDECLGTEDDEMMEATQVYMPLGGDEHDDQETQAYCDEATQAYCDEEEEGTEILEDSMDVNDEETQEYEI